jgi:hypothetical protein
MFKHSVYDILVCQLLVYAACAADGSNADVHAKDRIQADPSLQVEAR